MVCFCTAPLGTLSVPIAAQRLWLCVSVKFAIIARDGAWSAGWHVDSLCTTAGWCQLLLLVLCPVCVACTCVYVCVCSRMRCAMVVVRKLCWLIPNEPVASAECTPLSIPLSPGANWPLSNGKHLLRTGALRRGPAGRTCATPGHPLHRPQGSNTAFFFCGSWCSTPVGWQPMPNLLVTVLLPQERQALCDCAELGCCVVVWQPRQPPQNEPSQPGRAHVLACAWRNSARQHG